ncbi:MAG: MFS transporter [Eubacterium sp.]
MERFIKKREKAAYGIAAMGSYMAAGVVQSYLMYFFTDILIVPSTFVMVLMIVARVWDAVNDPIMGVIIDSTNTKYGKMRPYVLAGSFCMLVSTIVLFFPFTSAPKSAKMVFAAVTYILFGMSYTIVDVPAMGLMSVATPNADERASLLSFYVTVGSVGSLLPVALLSVFQSFVTEKWVYFVMAVFVGVITFVSYFNLFLKSKERCSTHTEKIKPRDMLKVAVKNRPMLMTLLMSMIASPRYLIMPAAMYIATYVIHIRGMNSGAVLILLYLVVGTGMFAGILLAPVVYKKIGYKNTCIIFAVIGTAGLVSAYFAGMKSYFIAMPFMTIGGLGLGAYNVLPYPMVGDSLDYLEWKTGERMEGTCFSLNSFVTKFNNAVGFIGLSVALILFKFQEPTTAGVALEQTEFTKNGLFSLVTIIPGISFLLSLIPVFFYNFSGKNRVRILNELNQKRNIQND